MRGKLLFDLNKLLLFLIFFLFPTQLALHFWPSWSFVYGVRIDYFSPAIYLIDLLIVSYLVANLEAFKSFLLKNNKIVLFTLCFAVLNLLFSLLFVNSLVRWTRILTYFYFLFFVYQSTKETKAFLVPLGLGVTVSGALALFQVLLQNSIGGVFYFLGERTFSAVSLGAALFQVGGHTFLRAYSTFSHPNSLGGFGLLSFSLFYLFLKERGFRRKLFLTSSLLCIIFSFSKTAYFGLILFFLFLIIKNFRKSLFIKYINLAFLSLFLFSMLMPLISRNLLKRYPNYQESVYTRLVLSNEVLGFQTKKLTFGVGLNNFIKGGETLGKTFSESSFQPVHNVFLLVLVETGFLGLALVVMLGATLVIKLVARKRITVLLPVFLIIFTGVFDHYWLSLNQNLLLALLVFVSGLGETNKNYAKL